MTNTPPPDATPQVPTRLLTARCQQAGLSAAQTEAVRKWMAEQFRADEFAKLTQSGHTGDPIPLRDIFVDLPASGIDRWVNNTKHVLGALMGLSARPVLRTGEGVSDDDTDDCPPSEQPQSVGSFDDEAEEVARARRSNRRTAGVVLIGGPGQGKSTLSQLAAQLHRAALLYGEPVYAPAARASAAYVNRGNGDPLPAPPAVPLLPLFLPLNELSAWLATSLDARRDDPAPSALRFLCGRPSAQAAGLMPESLHALCASGPSLIILDGIDEVGAGQDRDRIIAAARALVQVISGTGQATLLLTTTRPQGYQGEFEGIAGTLRQWRLDPLNKNDALRYAERLLTALEPGADERAKLLRRMNEAAQDPATALLLTTPLQVLLMAGLVRFGAAPRERWSLFKGFYDYTYKREIDRDSYATPLLRQHRTQIEELHRRVALVLQAETEQVGAAPAELDRSRLLTITRAVLEDEGHEADRAANLAQQLADIAERRLVLLVESNPGRFGFEIRSLQEFFSAWALTQGAEAQIEARMRQIAAAPTMRNTFLFAASRAYSEGLTVRDQMADLCRELQSGSDEVLRWARAGALLAFDLLKEGAVLPQPKRARALMEVAVAVLDLPRAGWAYMLSVGANDDTAASLEAAVSDRLERARDAGWDHRAAWVALASAVARQQPWALRLWPQAWLTTRQPGDVLEELNAFGLAQPSGSLRSLTEVADRVRPAELYRVGSLGMMGPIRDSARTWAEVFASSSWIGQLAPNDPNRRRLARVLDGLPTPPASWRCAASLQRFAVTPTPTLLGVALREIATEARRYSAQDWVELLELGPWQVGLCALWAGTPHRMVLAASLAERGVLGDVEAWSRMAEDGRARGRNHTVVWLTHAATALVPWDSEAEHARLPFRVFGLTGRASRPLHTQSPPDLSPQAINELEAAHEITESPLLKFTIGRLLYATRRAAGPDPTVDEIAAWLGVGEMIAPELIGPAPHVPIWQHLGMLDWELDLSAWLENHWGESGMLARRPPWMVARRLDQPDVRQRGDIDEATLHALGELDRAAGQVAHRSAEDHLWSAVLRQLKRANDPAAPNVLALAIQQHKEDDDTVARVLEYVESHPPLRKLLASTAVCEAVGALARNTTHHGLGDITALFALHLLTTRQSGLAAPQTWRLLALPMPGPAPAAISDPSSPSEAWPAPVILAQLKVDNLRGLGRFEIKPPPPPPDHGQWTYLLGPNGTGKTTLLRALCVALRDITAAGIWPKGLSSAPWVRVGGPPKATIRVSLNGDTHQVTIRRDGDESFTPATPGPTHLPLFAYGARRGSALGGADRQVDLETDAGPEIATLFDEGASLVHAETWLLNWALKAKQQPELHEKTFNDIMGAIRKLLNVASVEVSEAALRVRATPDAPALPPEALSDGYLTTMGWFVDLVARWLARAERLQLPVPAQFLDAMTGLVLIDEVDLHLHPRWQLDVIKRIRELLPRMSFVVTTHNPLTLVGARPEEVWVLSTEDGEVQVRQGSDDPRLLTAADLFQSFFGLDDVFPGEPGRAMRDYQQLARRSSLSAADEATLEAAERTLRDAGVAIPFPRRGRAGGEH